MKKRLKILFSGWRIAAVISVFGFAYLFLIFNIYNIQFKKNAFYEAQAESQQKAIGALDPTRGSIYFTDKNNNHILTVLNKEFQFIYAVPEEIQRATSSQQLSINNAQVYAQKLSPILNIPAADLERKFSKPNDLFESLVLKASDDQVNAVKNLNLKGIYIKNQVGRYYPFETLGSQILGFVAPSDNTNSATLANIVGRYGVEEFFNDDLAGTPGNVTGDKVVPPVDGGNIYLTIDRNIQAQAEDTLKNLVSEKGATGGSILVEDPKTGKILTIANYPDFDPNDYSKYDIKNFLNPTVQKIYEPGSIFKILTMAAGIDSGKITPETTYYDKGYDIINGRKIMNWDHKAYGLMTMTNVIEHSLNTGTVFAEQTMGHDIFRNYITKFGIGELTGIKLPGEVKGNLYNIEHGRDINYATASYGQGISATPLEMINAASAIANGGVLMKPLILDGDQPEVIRRVISEDTAKKVTQMMVSDVQVNVLAEVPNYTVAGKSGTAFVPDLQHGGYTNDVIDSFIGFAPAFDPKFVLMIKLDEPVGAPLSGTAVVPAFRQLTEFILNYYNVPPDNIGH